MNMRRQSVTTSWKCFYMSKIVTNIITKNDEGYTSYGSSIVSVQDTETGEIRTATVDYSPSKSEAEATAEAIEEASNKFK